ncbi:hypothetical protein SMC3_07330 [Candidatus Cryosericum hinesii]|jgi:hypothetical protein|uniref:Uncharacterized protein n=1 Tax=Candidatus Cryosericum hinesii TaxID=2290915 RepID=A0A398DJ13_9BACT|nr:hypothetical protein [Candidatus Cryosericum hinesii]RIE10210.1 hypothetical protein SMC4_02730 [Candidatus Cryosericum hinesii]RIE12197.1 hypothetical protein SMC3_07330 [Candidatus Cryosericum hinesii]RIE12331.1 hypothetical protein SMC2_06940 [Candidatus Cryosericum hinesii]
MNTKGLVRFIVIGIVLLLVISVGGYSLYRALVASSRDKADVNTIYQVVGEFGARLRNIATYPLHDLEDLAAKEGIRVRTVNGIKVFHTKDGRDLEMSTTSDGSDCVVDHGEVMLLKSALQWQLNLPITGEIASSAEDTSEQYLSTKQAVDANLKELITDRLYQAFVRDPSTIPGRSAYGEWPDEIRIDSIQKVDDTSFSVSANVIFVTSVQTARGRGTTWKKPITLTLKKVNGTWLIDDVTGGPKA